MKKILIINILLLIVSVVYTQKTGVITYERKQFWINIMSKFPFATKERIERDMMAWGKNQGKYSDKYFLYFKDNQTLYIQKENEENFGWSWKEDSYLLTRNHTDKTGKDLIGLLGKEYIIEEAMPKYKWKNLNDKKLNILWLRYLTEMDKLMDMQKANISLPEEILQAMELTHESNYTPEQLAAYDKYIDAIRTEKTLIAEAEVKGEARGEIRGKRQTAINLKKLGLLTNQQIADATGLTLSEIETL